MRSKLFGALSLVAAASASAGADPLTMTASGQCEQVRDLVIDTVVHQLVAGYGYGYQPYYYGGGAIRMPVADRAAPMPAATAAPAGAPVPAAPQQPAAAPPNHYTTTNTQERGVDEADIVKTDGKFVYTLRNNELLIAKTWPVDKTDITARLSFKTLSPQQLYLHGNQILVQGYATQTRTPAYPYGATRLLVIDAADHAHPRLKTIYDIDGGSYSSRVVGDDLYFVQNGGLQIPTKLAERAQKLVANVPRADQNSLRPWEIQSRLAAMLHRTLQKELTQQDIAAMLPSIRGANGKTTMTCDQLFVPPNTMQLGLTAIAHISLASGATDFVGAMIAGQVYASTDALYVAAPNYGWNQLGYALYTTQIHEFSLRGKPAYVASGSVEGQLLNQFSMSEYKGDLRVATTDWSWNGSQGGNHVFVMRPHGNRLDVIGALHGLAKGERIYAGRFFDDKGYLVTFRQTDPLFTLDLRDPTHPRVVGELKINGFSSYIHPMGNNLLLTIGQDANDQGRVKGMHLQVFDVSDPANPTRRFHESIADRENGYSYSMASGDHHAFTYDPVTGTLAVPPHPADRQRDVPGHARLPRRCEARLQGARSHRSSQPRRSHDRAPVRDREAPEEWQRAVPVLAAEPGEPAPAVSARSQHRGRSLPADAGHGGPDDSQARRSRGGRSAVVGEGRRPRRDRAVIQNRPTMPIERLVSVNATCAGSVERVA